MLDFFSLKQQTTIQAAKWSTALSSGHFSFMLLCNTKLQGWVEDQHFLFKVKVKASDFQDQGHKEVRNLSNVHQKAA